MGFLEFLLAVCMVIVGLVLLFVGTLSCSLFSMPGTPSWIIPIVGFVVMLGGVYMLRRR